MKLTIKAKSQKTIMLEMYNLQYDGWEVIIPMYRNFWGTWVIKMEKNGTKDS